MAELSDRHPDAPIISSSSKTHHEHLQHHSITTVPHSGSVLSGGPVAGLGPLSNQSVRCVHTEVGRMSPVM
ncbi:hypothetical protein JOQ06_026953 [Pogonophryne albipinna]|uniref:Uncharacterized protein n=1 Tax=Pogonophryne albipinna TaxID=1090488 RepID=A0AAD6BEG4_9TELE|nr:hypothetical protein JOQ06_026953 [Pogonophryne albipinna]